MTALENGNGKPFFVLISCDKHIVNHIRVWRILSASIDSVVDVQHCIISLWNEQYNGSSKSAQDQMNSTCSFSDSSAERFSKLFAFCFILLGSLFGNIFIIIIVYKYRDLRKTINYFIVNMALSDLVYPLIVFPVKITELVTESFHWRVSGIFGSICCKSFFFASLVSLHVSTQSLVWIAIDRFVAVVFPMRLGLISSRIRAIAIVSSWICAGSFSFPLLISSKLVVRGNDTVCTEVNSESSFVNQKANSTYVWFQFAFLIMAPLFLITVLYTGIVITLKRQNIKTLTDNATDNQGYAMKKRRQAVKMAVLIVVFYYLCVTPHILLYFIPYWKPACALQRVVYFVADFSFYFSSIVNPIICLSFVESYRRRLKNILCPYVRKRNNMMTKREQISLRKRKSVLDE